jgi:hypothetical protein
MFNSQSLETIATSKESILTLLVTHGSVLRHVVEAMDVTHLFKFIKSLSNYIRNLEFSKKETYNYFLFGFIKIFGN